MNKTIDRYQVPECSMVELEMDGTILSVSSLSQDGFNLDQYEDLKDVEW